LADGRFAPSPTGRLHLGNLRTALLAWLFARSTGGRFLVRMEDLDAGSVRPEHLDGQLHDLAALGLDWDGEVVRQSERRRLYDAAIARLDTYPCWCTRREIQEAASAPHGPPGAYPGTCRDRDPATAPADRAPALRLRSGHEAVTVHDRLRGEHIGVVDDLVLRRGDGTPAYNLAVVVDDADQGIDEVVRGDDLLPSTPRQVHLARLLGFEPPAYAHVPLALGPDGARLAKRHGAVTLGELDPGVALTMMAVSLGLADDGETVTPSVLLGRFDPDRLPSDPWVP
jgi:glutamyl-tRNA synthetase